MNKQTSHVCLQQLRVNAACLSKSPALPDKIKIIVHLQDRKAERC